MGWQRICDLDGTAPAELVTFGFDGSAYALALGPTQYEKLKAALQPFLLVARNYDELPIPPADDYIESEVVPDPTPTPAPRVTRAPSTRKAPAKRPTQKTEKASVLIHGVDPSKTQSQLIRTWANENGYSVGPKGRIPAAIVSAFETKTPAGA